MDVSKNSGYASPPGVVRDETIDLVSLGMPSACEWGMGKSVAAGHGVSSINQTVKNILNESGNGFVLFLCGDLAPPEETLSQIIRNDTSIDVWYDDTITEALQWPGTLDFVSPVNY